MSIIETHGVTVSYGGRAVLREASLTLQPGESVSLMGANGSGKSTLVRAILGLAPLTAGKIELFDTPQRRFRDWKRIGYVPQRLGVAGGVPSTVGEVVAAGRLAHRRLLMPSRKRDRAVISDSLEAVGLAHRATEAVTTLSGGQQQRVLIARALATEPDLLILDEPTVGVDADTQATLAEVVGDRIRAGCAVLLVTHELGPLSSTVERALMLSEGDIIYEGPAPSGDHDCETPEQHPVEQGEHCHGDQTTVPDRNIWGAT
ncbi:metal ABC transporter ATP-binding protein [Natronoglycomyces albus]|uniref:Metal ABC transporter ATP-binding protein n=1 Tax=Natronoglycomyces albus TaxID=2811108 RepID=A0A895XQ61_9ACTN|nr:metal ABC transporter ATP-binding protein [Natronoglycomyces albus]QSB04410.1 metal ABC transporter ATP-binding protein [Natronoglycomyces albus]